MNTLELLLATITLIATLSNGIVKTLIVWNPSIRNAEAERIIVVKNVKTLELTSKDLHNNSLYLYTITST